MNSGRQLIMALDYTIIFVAMPSLGEALGFSANHLQWVVSAYSLTFGNRACSHYCPVKIKY